MPFFKKLCRVGFSRCSKHSAVRFRFIFYATLFFHERAFVFQGCAFIRMAGIVRGSVRGMPASTTTVSSQLLFFPPVFAFRHTSKANFVFALYSDLIKEGENGPRILGSEYTDRI